MKDINLISPSNQRKKERQNSGLAQELGIVFLAVLVLGMLGYGGLAFLHTRLETKEVAIQQQIQAASPIVAVKRDIQLSQGKIDQLTGLIDIAGDQSAFNTRLLDGIAKVMPENVFTVSYALDQTGKLNIMGKSKDMDSIAYFISKLKGSGLFSDVYLSNVSSVINNANVNSDSGSTDYNFAALLTLEK